MRVLYFDCFAGVSGDMMVGALLDLGLDFDHLKEELAGLGLSGYRLSVDSVTRGGIAATRFNVEVEEKDQPARHLSDIVELINRSSLSEEVKLDSIRIFTRLGEAEARVHDTTIDRVHFHEVGAVDSIIDIVGAVIGLKSARRRSVLFFAAEGRTRLGQDRAWAAPGTRASDGRIAHRSSYLRGRVRRRIRHPDRGRDCHLVCHESTPVCRT